jgi:OmpA-OmpF porin, OOP family
MSKKTLYLAFILLTIIVGTVLFWYYCCACGGKNHNTEAAPAVESTVPGEQIAPPPAPLPDSVTSVDWQAIKDQLNSNPPVLIFEVYKTESSPDQVFTGKLEEITDYMNNNPDGAILVNGHSDISGPRSLNMKLSQGRADFIKSYLVQYGIGEELITTFSLGPDEPAYDNSTAEGRAKNRRAVVLIK